MKEGGAGGLGVRQSLGSRLNFYDQKGWSATNEGNKNTAGTNLLKHLDCCISYYLLYRPTAVRGGGWAGVNICEHSISSSTQIFTLSWPGLRENIHSNLLAQLYSSAINHLIIAASNCIIDRFVIKSLLVRWWYWQDLDFDTGVLTFRCDLVRGNILFKVKCEGDEGKCLEVKNKIHFSVW